MSEKQAICTEWRKITYGAGETDPHGGGQLILHAWQSPSMSRGALVPNLRGPICSDEWPPGG